MHVEAQCPLSGAGAWVRKILSSGPVVWPVQGSKLTLVSATGVAATGFCEIVGTSPAISLGPTPGQSSSLLLQDAAAECGGTARARNPSTRQHAQQLSARLVLHTLSGPWRPPAAAWLRCRMQQEGP